MWPKRTSKILPRNATCDSSEPTKRRNSEWKKSGNEGVVGEKKLSLQFRGGEGKGRTMLKRVQKWCKVLPHVDYFSKCIMAKTRMIKSKKEHSAISHECNVDVHTDSEHRWSTHMGHTDDPDIKYAFCRLYTHVRYEYNVTRVDCANILQIFC